MNIGALSTNTTSTCAFAGTTARVQDLRKLQQDIENNLAKFHQRTVKGFPGFGNVTTYLPEKVYWFSNEYTAPNPLRKAVKLADSFAGLPTSKPLSGYRVAITTGEGGFFVGLPEIAACCDLIVQLDCDPRPLQLSAHLLEEIKKTENYPESLSDQKEVLARAISNFQAANPEINDIDVLAINRFFDHYIAGMKRHIFSSAERFAEFKRWQDHPVQQVCLDYFSKEAMNALAETLKDHNASVRFLNISNVCEYPEEFYKAIPFDDNGTNISITPSQYVQGLPFSDDAICAYSQLFGSRLFTATATIPKMADALYGSAISGRNRDLRALSSKYDRSLYTWFLEQAAYEGMPARDRELVDSFIDIHGTGPSHQLPTRIFRLFAKHPVETRYDWILWLTAGRLTSSEVEELKVHKKELKADYLESHPVDSMNSQPPFFSKILDMITAETTQAETVQPMDCATNSQTAPLWQHSCGLC